MPAKVTHHPPGEAPTGMSCFSCMFPVNARTRYQKGWRKEEVDNEGMEMVW